MKVYVYIILAIVQSVSLFAQWLFSTKLMAWAGVSSQSIGAFRYAVDFLVIVLILWTYFQGNKNQQKFHEYIRSGEMFSFLKKSSQKSDYDVVGITGFILSVVLMLRDVWEYLWMPLWEKHLSHLGTALFLPLWKWMLEKNALYIAIPLLVLAVLLLFLWKKGKLPQATHAQIFILFLYLIHYVCLLINWLNRELEQRMPEPVIKIGALYQVIIERAGTLMLVGFVLIMTYYLVRLVRFALPKGGTAKKDAYITARLLIITVSAFATMSVPLDEIKAAWSQVKQWLITGYNWLKTVIPLLTWQNVLGFVFSAFVLLVIVTLLWRFVGYCRTAKPTLADVEALLRKPWDLLRNLIYVPLRTWMTGNQTGGSRFDTLYTLATIGISFIICAFGIVSVYPVIAGLISDKEELSQWTYLEIADTVLKSVFAGVVALVFVLIAVVVVLILLKYAYTLITASNKKLQDSAAELFSAVVAMLIAAFLLVQYFKGNGIEFGSTEWVDAMLNFVTIFAAAVIYMLVSIVVFLLLSALHSFFKGDGIFSEQKKSAEEYLKDIAGALVDTVLGGILVALTFTGDFVTNLYVTAFDTLDDDKYQEMKDEHMLIDESTAKLLYSEGDTATLVKEIENMKVQDTYSVEEPEAQKTGDDNSESK